MHVNVDLLTLLFHCQNFDINVGCEIVKNVCVQNHLIISSRPLL